MTDLLLPAVVGVVVVAVAGLVGRVLRARRRRALAADGTAVWRVRLRGGTAPYPARGRRGRLLVGPGDALVYRGDGGPVLDLAPTGLQPLGWRPEEPHDRATDQEGVLLCRDGLGTTVRLAVRDAALEQLEQVLAARALPPEPDLPRVLVASLRPPLLLPVLLGLAGAAVLGLSAQVLLTAERVTGTVVGADDQDDWCPVRWTDPRDGTVETRRLECFGLPVGEDFPLLLPGPPLEGEAVDADDPPFWAAAGGTGLVLGLGIGVARWRRAQTDGPAAEVLQAAPPEPAPSVVPGPDGLERDRVEQVLRARARSEGWDPDPDPAAPLPLRERPAVQRSVALVLALAPLLAGLVLALIPGWTSTAALIATRGPTEEVVARATGWEPVGVVPLLVDQVEVSFDLTGGGRETTLVLLRDDVDPDEGDPVPLRYDLDDPDRVRATEHDGTLLGLAGAGALVLTGAVWTAWRTTRLVRARRAEARARRGPVRRVPYLLAPDWDGTCVLLLYDLPQGAPRLCVNLDGDARGRVPVAGTLEVHARYRDGEDVVVALDGRELRTSSPLLELDEETTASIVAAEPLPDA